MSGEETPDKKVKDTEAQGSKKTDEVKTGSTTKPRSEVPAENKTVIKNKVVNKDVKRVDRTSIDFNISVGVAVPRTVTLVTLPPTVIEVVPEYEGYLYFVMDDGTLVIVDPGTLEIVDVIA